MNSSDINMFLCLLSSNYEIPYLNTFLHYLLFVYPSQVYNSRAPTAPQVSRAPDTITSQRGVSRERVFHVSQQY